MFLYMLHPIHVYTTNQWFISIISKTERKQIFIYKIIRQNCYYIKFTVTVRQYEIFYDGCLVLFAIGDECNISWLYNSVVAIGYIAIHSNDKAFAKWKLLLNTKCFTDGVFLPYYLLFYFCYFFSSLLVYPIYYVILYKPST